MAFKIIKTYKEHLPALRLIGKRYTDENRGEDGSFSDRWQDWSNKFVGGLLEKAGNPSYDIPNGPVGLMTINCENHSDFAYWTGILFPTNSPVPDGFDHLDLPENDVGVSWIYGSDKNGEIYGGEPHSACYKALCDNGWGNLNTNAGGKNTLVFFERYNCPRMSTPDEHGNVILDYGFYLKG